MERTSSETGAVRPLPTRESRFQALEESELEVVVVGAGSATAG